MTKKLLERDDVRVEVYHSPSTDEICVEVFDGDELLFEVIESPGDLFLEHITYNDDIDFNMEEDL